MPLTDKEIKVIKPLEKAKKYFDGGGLYLEVTPDGGKRWRLKYRFGGREKRISLGVYPKVSLKQAREEACKAKEAIESGTDPSSIRKQQKVTSEFVFRDLVNLWLQKHIVEVKETTFRSIKRLLSRVEKSAIWREIPEKIKPRDVLIICKKIEEDVSSVTARRALSVISTIFKFGVVSGYVDSNPCRDINLGLASHRTVHYPAITDPAELGKFLQDIDNCGRDYIIRASVIFQLLCMSRPSEIRFLQWSEVFIEDKIIRISAERMKISRDHLIPISVQASIILENVRRINKNTEYVFAHRVKNGKDIPLGNTTITALLRELGYRGIMVPHGFRSTASTLLNEMGWPPDVIEAQLAHAIPGVRAVYNRAVYLDERRRMLQAWADYLYQLRMKAAPV